MDSVTQCPIGPGQFYSISRSGQESTLNLQLVLVSRHEEPKDEVDGFLAVVWSLSAHQVGRRSDKEAGKECRYEAGC